jgi:hypothetical protein
MTDKTNPTSPGRTGEKKQSLGEYMMELVDQKVARGELRPGQVRLVNATESDGADHVECHIFVGAPPHVARDTAELPEDQKPTGLEVCPKCCEHRGTVRLRDLNWKGYYAQDECEKSDKLIRFRCLCEGVPCTRCGQMMVHRPGSNSYDEESNRVWHHGIIPGADLCEECRAPRRKGAGIEAVDALRYLARLGRRGGVLHGSVPLDSMDGDALAAEIKTSVPDMEDADIVAMAVAARRRLLGRSGHPGHAVGDS